MDGEKTLLEKLVEDQKEFTFKEIRHIISNDVKTDAEKIGAIMGVMSVLDSLIKHASEVLNNADS